MKNRAYIFILSALVILSACHKGDSLSSDLSGGFYYINDFGAKSEKGFLNTAMIQAAIDKCSADGGGYVIIPRGEFLTGTIELKQGVILYLERGARLQGSSEMKDYTKHLIRAIDADDIGIAGHGVIDGNGPSFWFKRENGTYDHVQPSPGYMILLENCNHIKISDVLLQNAEAWTLHLLGCTDVHVKDIRIRNPLHGPTVDGIDIQACQNVTVSGCDIYTPDDAIVLKNRYSKYVERPCRNITVTDCILTSVCNCFKIGTETTGNFGNIVFSNSAIRTAQPTDPLAAVRVSETGLTLLPSSGISVESVDGSEIDGVVISNITMEEVRSPIFIRLANRGEGIEGVPTVGKIRNVMISNINVGYAHQTSSVTAIPGHYVENVSFNNINLNIIHTDSQTLVYKDVPENESVYPDASMWGNLPATGFYVRHASGVSFNMVRLEVDGEDNRPAIIFDDAEDVVVNGLVLNENHIGTSAIKLINTRGALLTNCDVKDGVRFLYELSGGLNRDIRVNETDIPDIIIASDAKTDGDMFEMKDFINENGL